IITLWRRPSETAGWWPVGNLYGIAALQLAVSQAAPPRGLFELSRALSHSIKFEFEDIKERRRRRIMNLSDLTPLQIGIIAAVFVLVVGGILFFVMQRRRTDRLRTKFGPEYERAVAEGGDRRSAEAKLSERAERVESFHLRPLASTDRARFVEAWTKVQTHFVDAPAGAVAEADQLLGDVMATRGYPVG